MRAQIIRHLVVLYVLFYIYLRSKTLNPGMKALNVLPVMIYTCRRPVESMSDTVMHSSAADTVFIPVPDL